MFRSLFCNHYYVYQPKYSKHGICATILGSWIVEPYGRFKGHQHYCWNCKKVENCKFEGNVCIKCGHYLSSD